MTNQVAHGRAQVRRRVLALVLAVAWVVLVVVISREYGFVAAPFCATGGGLLGYLIPRLAR